MSDMSSLHYDEAEEFRERIKKMVKLNESSSNYGQCAQINPNYLNPNYCGASLSYQPAYEPPKSDQEIYYRSIGVENQKLLQEKQRLVNQILMLQNELRIVKEENFNYKFKAEKKKWNIDVTIYNFFTKVGTGFKSIYQDILNWFNT